MVMGRLLFLVLLTVAIGAAVPAATASAASSGSDGVTGIGMLGQFGDPTVQVSAVQTGPAAGGFTIAYPDQSFATGQATCLFVAGNTAYLTGRITSSGGPRQQPENWLPGNYIVIGVRDSGQLGTAGPDRLNFSPGFAANPGCGPNGAAVPVFRIVWGNYLVSAHG